VDAAAAQRWWGRLERLFDAARMLPPGRRAAFIDRECADDPELHRELASLLQYAPGDSATSSLLVPPRAAVATASDRLTSALDPRVGLTLRQYRIEARIGGGGMGVVYRARDTRLHRPVALKFLAPALASHASANRRFLAEARAVAAIDHPNICTVYEVDESADGTPFIAMAYHVGETLRERLARGRLTIRAATQYVTQTGEALRAAHTRGIIHRDVKPGNIFITDADGVKLLDFGIAKIQDLVLTTRGVVLGTVGYMSPEQLRGEPVDARADVWSLGVVLFEALTSHLPFRGNGKAKIIESVLRDDLPSLTSARPDAPLRFDPIIRRAVAKAPEDRYPGVDELLRALASAAIADEPV
jgi:serine/threonine-protein kinase